MTADNITKKTRRRIAAVAGAVATICLAFSALAPAEENTPDDSGVVVEWAPFELIDGTDEATLLQLSEKVQSTFLDKQDGFIQRELLRGKDSQWVDIVYWASMEAAEQAATNAATSVACREYFSLMIGPDPEDPTAGVLHLERVRIYGSQTPPPGHRNDP